MKSEGCNEEIVTREDLNREIDFLRREYNERHLRHELHFQKQEEARIIAFETMRTLMETERNYRSQALEEAKESLKEYKHNSNQFRSELDKQGEKYVTISVFNLHSDRIKALENKASEWSGGSIFFQKALSVLSMLLAALAIIISVLFR